MKEDFITDETLVKAIKYTLKGFGVLGALVIASLLLIGGFATFWFSVVVTGCLLIIFLMWGGMTVSLIDDINYMSKSEKEDIRTLKLIGMTFSVIICVSWIGTFVGLLL